MTGMTAAPLLQVAARCFQLMASVFQAPAPVAVPYIRALGPPLLRFLQVLVFQMDTEKKPTCQDLSFLSMRNRIWKEMMKRLLFRRWRGVVPKVQRT